jgi:hypothetical protein
MFRTSHPESTEYIPLTSKVLDYGGKKKLEEYPYFDPDIEFTDDMRRKIQNKTYDEKLELFFIKDIYANEIGYSNQDTKPRTESTSHIDAFISKMPLSVRKEFFKIYQTKDRKTIEKSMKTFLEQWKEQLNSENTISPTNESKDKPTVALINVSKTKMKEVTRVIDDALKDLRNKVTFTSKERNFEFMLQTILCTGFPVSNYFQTMEFYDSSITNKKITLKGSNAFLPIGPKRFQRCFSHIKEYGEVHTITSVTWINDVLNHEHYRKVMESYAKYDGERNKLDEKKVNAQKDVVDRKAAEILIEIAYDADTWKNNESDKNDLRNRDRQMLMDKVNELIKEIRPEANNTNYKLVIEDKTKNDFLDKYPNIKTAVNKENDDNKKEIVLRNILIRDYENIKDLNIKSTVKNYLEGNDQKDMIKKIKELVRTIDNKVLASLSSTVSYKRKLESYVKRLKLEMHRDEMYTIVKNKLDFRDRDEQEVKEIELLLKNEFPNYSAYANAMVALEKRYIIDNEHWKLEAKKFVGKANDFFIAKDETETKSPIEMLMKCFRRNAACKKSDAPEMMQYLQLGLDELKASERKDSDRMFEAYVQLNVTSEKIDDTNYSKLFCPYVDEVLGESWANYTDKNTNGENLIIKHRPYIDLKQKKGVPPVNVKSNVKNKSKKSKDTPTKIGGKRRRTRRRRRHSRNYSS